MKKHLTLDPIIRRLIASTRPIRRYLLLSAALSLILIACAVAAPKLLGAQVDKLYAYDGAAGLAASLTPGLLILGGIYAAQAAARYANSYLLNHAVSRYYSADLRIRISEKLARLPISYLDKTPAGDILDRMQEDVSTMGSTVHTIVEVLITGFLQLLIISLFLFFTDWRLALVVVLLAPASMLLSGRLATLGEKHWQTLFEQGGELYAVTEECYTNFAVTKAFNQEAAMQQRYDALNAAHQKTSARANFLSSIVQPAIVFVDALAYIAIALLGGWLILRRGMAVGTVVTVILYVRQFSSPLERIAFTFGELQQTKAAAKRVFDLLDLPEEPQGKAVPAGPVRGEVRFSHVDFSYTPDKPLIRDLDLTIRPGQNVAIVGPTGAGKTTIVNLLMRFYDPDAGSILIDGEDVAALSRASVRGMFGMVLQDTWLFRGTVAENVAYGKPEATREEIIRACDRVYCDHFIRTLPQGYDTVISEDSTALSAGQKQLLTIARALLADRQLLILDEATSNVDTRTEIYIQKAMDKLMKGRTCFVIAHRLSTIMGADRILVVRDGQIVEQGTHRELLDKGGFYHTLYYSQYEIR